MIAIPEEFVVVSASCPRDETFAFNGITHTPLISPSQSPSISPKAPLFVPPNPIAVAATSTTTTLQWTSAANLAANSTSNPRKRRRECYHAQQPEEEQEQEATKDNPHSLDTNAFANTNTTSLLCSLTTVSETSATTTTTSCLTVPGLPSDQSSSSQRVGSKKRKHQEDTNTSSNSTAKNNKYKTQSLGMSIHKDVRRRLQYMTYGTRLIPRKLSPIVTTPNGVVSKLPVQQQQQQTLFLRNHALLGKGAFAIVRSVTIENEALPPATTTTATTNESNSCTSSDKKIHRCHYACKSIKEKLFALATRAAASELHKRTVTETDRNKKHRRAYVQAESQLAYEAHILGSLNHTNIIKLVGFFSSPLPSSSDKNANDSCCIAAMETTEMDYEGRPVTTIILPPEGPKRSVLLTEILEETLAQKISRWRTTTYTATTLEKLTICQQLAEALEHLHSHNIAYRDLKPENAGFLGSTLKLFDFGLSREMLLHQPPCSINKTETHQHGNASSLSSSSTTYRSLLKGVIGTMRYMAPEVCLEESYDLDCDLYSYSVVCWEIWTHRTPYANLTPSSYKELVGLGGLRPPDFADEESPPPPQGTEERSPPHVEIPPKPVLALLEKGWVRDPKARIRWKSIRRQLLGILLQRRG